ncbi:MAG: hypothetical protein K6B65_03950 [Bacilli bacterium]|nr:hypothetical protein [Bacilli bacterium]
MNILVTGFRKYATHDANPSELVLKQIRRDGVKTLLLPVEYEESRKEFEKVVGEFKPEAIVILALSPFIKRPTLEQYGYNEANSIQPDEKGVLKTSEAIEKDAPAHIVPSVDLPSIQQYILSQGGKCDISIDPGRFVGNQIYYLALRETSNSVMLHLPLPSDYSVEDSFDAVESILDFLDY